MPTAAPIAPRGVAARRRGAAPAPPPTTAGKRVRPPTSDSSPLASSPLRRPANDTIVVSEGLYRSPMKRSRIGVETPPAAFTTPPCHDTAPTTSSSNTLNATTTRAVPPTFTPLTTSVPEDVMKICGMQDRHARALTTALAIVYEADLDTETAYRPASVASASPSPQTPTPRFFYKRALSSATNSSGHHARNYRKPPRYAYYGGGHDTRTCDALQDKRRCPNYREAHPAFSRACAFTRVTTDEARQAAASTHRPPPARPDASHAR
ncbi:hypothetical protein SBRCBS47491_004490 [Sporothrix bragantina]|uniref:Uncharacterized protein n=1 Tax=Sporothrix bragantina TaxID=671064 RepID=A0ABP0BNZ0_9PEZI